MRAERACFTRLHRFDDYSCALKKNFERTKHQHWRSHSYLACQTLLDRWLRVLERMGLLFHWSNFRLLITLSYLAKIWAEFFSPFWRQFPYPRDPNHRYFCNPKIPRPPYHTLQFSQSTHTHFYRFLIRGALSHHVNSVLTRTIVTTLRT